MNKQLYKCKYYPKETDNEYKNYPCGNCKYLAEFIHCSALSYEENEDLYRRVEFLNKKVYCDK
jgi:hypothetical protein